MAQRHTSEYTLRGTLDNIPQRPWYIHVYLGRGWLHVTESVWIDVCH